MEQVMASVEDGLLTLIMWKDAIAIHFKGQLALPPFRRRLRERQIVLGAGVLRRTEDCSRGLTKKLLELSRQGCGYVCNSNKDDGKEAKAQDEADRVENAAGADTDHHESHLRHIEGTWPPHNLRHLGPRQVVLGMCQEVGLRGLTGKRHMKIILRWMRERQKLRLICNHVGPHKQFLYTTWFTKPSLNKQSRGPVNEGSHFPKPKLP
ncbi:hypothetical protein SAY87_028742 [Trapa incisa]|uniref:Uncharacterized protein n=1 Tax=Trapa incisa TaxID=236973 RepID=A0AAN7L0C4_9MYRT|nr:hypothetical protein SAY87_028742 [Trapa incisa]